MFMFIQFFNSDFYRGDFWRESSATSSFSRHFIRFPPRNFELLAPSGNTKAYSVDRDDFIKSNISCLLYGRFPAAVFRFIVSVVVDTPNRMFSRGSFAHVCKEVFKAVSPSVAHRNPALPIAWVLWIIGAITAKFEFCPRMVFRSSGHTVGQLKSIFSQKVSSCFFCEASATESRFSYISGSCGGKVSAVASALPHSVSRAFNSNSIKHVKSPNILMPKIKCWHHNFLLFGSHTKNNTALGEVSICRIR